MDPEAALEDCTAGLSRAGAMRQPSIEAARHHGGVQNVAQRPIFSTSVIFTQQMTAKERPALEIPREPKVSKPSD